VAAELGDLRRFRRASQLMAYVGLVPSEHSTGSSRRQGRITKTGNAHVRRALVEAAWAYRFRPSRSRAIQAREAALDGFRTCGTQSANIRLISRRA
jgi:transposase